MSVAALSANAADNFVGMTWGQSDSRIENSGSLNRSLNNPDLDRVIDGSGTWGVRAGQETRDGRYYVTYENVSDDSQGYKLRQQHLLASYDAFLPLNNSGTKLFGGATAGVVKLEQDGSGLKRDSDIGLAAGLQAGVLQDVGKNASLEAGYRYMKTNASTEVSPHGGGKVGSLDLERTSQVFIGANYKF
nr:porin family protein [Pseudomonas alcaligenes]